MPDISINIMEEDFSQLFLMFIIYSFVGWIGEEIWCTVGTRKIVKRGMLHGPICPIYGFGALGILFLVYPWRTTFVRLFLASVIVTSLLEYFSSWLLERLFRAKWWDYSDEKFNLNGRICLLNSVVFGLGGVALEHVMHPAVQYILAIPIVFQNTRTIALALASILTVDLLFTLRKLVDFTATMARFKLFGEQLRERFEGEEWFRPESLQTMLASVKERALTNKDMFSKKFLETIESYSDLQHSVVFWLKKFPSMSSTDFPAALEHMKTIVRESFSDKRKAQKGQAAPQEHAPEA